MQVKIAIKEDYYSNGSGRARKLLIPAGTELELKELTVDVPGRKYPLRVPADALILERVPDAGFKRLTVA